MHGWHKAVVGLLLGMSMMPSVSAAPEYDRKTKVATVSAVTSDGVLWTPATGSRVYVQQCAVSSVGPQLTILEINNVRILPPIYTSADVAEQFFVDATGATDETVTYTLTSSTSTTVVCNGYEFQG